MPGFGKVGLRRMPDFGKALLGKALFGKALSLE